MRHRLGAVGGENDDLLLRGEQAGFAALQLRNLLTQRCFRKLVESAQKSWRRLDGHNQLPKLVLGVTFADGIEVIAKPTDRQPTTAAA